MGNREETMERILEAGLLQLAEDGFASLGVNALARRSGTDKQLIYRYFGGMEGVFAALGTRVADRLLVVLDTLDPLPPANYGAMAQSLILALWRHLRSDGQYRQMRLMEVQAPSAATTAFAEARGKVLGQWLAQRSSGLARPAGDLPALNAALIAAVEGLAILGAAGLTEDAVARQEAALRVLVAGVYP